MLCHIYTAIIRHSAAFRVTADCILNPSLVILYGDSADRSMPKETDHLEDGGDKDMKEERAQVVSEETVRKRVRANSPSPHRGNTPQGEE